MLTHERQPFGIGRRIGGKIDPILQRGFRVALLHLCQGQVIARARRALLVGQRHLERLVRLRRHGAVRGEHLRFAPIAHDVGAMTGQIGGVAVSLDGIVISPDAHFGSRQQ